MSIPDASTSMLSVLLHFVMKLFLPQDVTFSVDVATVLIKFRLCSAEKNEDQGVVLRD